MNFVSC
jgi:hypothetical protein